MAKRTEAETGTEKAAGMGTNKRGTSSAPALRSWAACEGGFRGGVHAIRGWREFPP